MTRQQELAAVEGILLDTAVQRRDERVSVPHAHVGIVAHEYSGERSDIIRIGLAEAAVLALAAVDRTRTGIPNELEVDALAGAISEAIWGRDYVAESQQRQNQPGAPLSDDVRAIQARRAARAALTHTRSHR